jgi:hypothetical protein
MPTPRRHILKPHQRRAIALLAGCGAEGCTEAVMLHAVAWRCSPAMRSSAAGRASSSMRMDERFVHAVELAIRHGEEHTPKGRAAGMNTLHFTDQQTRQAKK